MAALQEEGWPLGLQPLNLRAGLVINRDLNGSLSFNTLLTGSPVSSADSSSDLDTESTGSSFHDRNITLGSLIGLSNILSLSQRSTRGRISESSRKKNYKSRTWFFSLCSRLTTDAMTTNNTTPSLGHFLEAERKAASNCQRNPSPTGAYGVDDFSHISDPNSLFIGGNIAPPISSENERTFSRDLLAHENADAGPLLLSCLCGNLAH